MDVLIPQKCAFLSQSMDTRCSKDPGPPELWRYGTFVANHQDWKRGGRPQCPNEGVVWHLGCDLEGSIINLYFVEDLGQILV